jgi:Subtilase family
MPLYIVRPRFSADEAVSLAMRSMASADRPRQLREMAGEREGDPAIRDVERHLEGAHARLVTRRRDAPATGTMLVDMSDHEAEQMRRELPDALVLRDQPIGLIEPRRAQDTEHKSKLAAADLWHLGLVGLAAARKRKTPFKGTGQGVTVAVLDTGVEGAHPEIAHAVTGAYTFDAEAWKAKRASKAVDTDGHGTHVAGLIAGKTVGVAPGASVMSAVMLPAGKGKLSDFVLALEWCASQPAIQIVNVSAGIRGYLSGMHTVVADLLAVGLLPVVACGNEGRNKTRSPGNYAEVLSVGAVDKRSKVSAFSSGGTIVSDRHHYVVPDLVAPGEGVFSCVKGGGYEAWDGTSMATPIVSGIAALVIERHPKITIGQLQEELLTTCKDLKQDEDRQGKGLVQVKAAL